MYTVLIKDKFYLYFFLRHFIHEIHNASYNIYYVTYDMWFLMTVMFNLMANTPSSSCAGDTVLTHPTIILPFPWFLDITLHQFSLLPLWPLAFTLFSWSFFFFFCFSSPNTAVYRSLVFRLLWSLYFDAIGDLMLSISQQFLAQGIYAALIRLNSLSLNICLSEHRHSKLCIENWVPDPFCIFYHPQLSQGQSLSPKM